MMRAVWCGMLSRFGFGANGADFDLAIHDWVCGIFHRLDEMLAQHRVGELVLVAQPLRKCALRKCDENARTRNSAHIRSAGDEQDAWPSLQLCADISDAGERRIAEFVDARAAPWPRAGSDFDAAPHTYFQKWFCDARKFTPLMFRLVIE